MQRITGTRFRPGCEAAILALFLTWFFPALGRAHPAYLTVAEATVGDDGRFQVMIRFDTLAFALNDTSARIGNAPMEELMAGPREALEAAMTDAKGRFIHGFKVATDRGPGQLDSIEFPDAAKVLAWKTTGQPLLPVVLPVQLTGRLPAGAQSVTFQFPEVLTQVELTVEAPGEEPLADAVEAGLPSIPFPLGSAAMSSPAAPRASRSPPPDAKPAGGVSKIDRRWAVYTLSAGFALLALFWAVRRGH